MEEMRLMVIPAGPKLRCEPVLLLKAISDHEYE